MMKACSSNWLERRTPNPEVVGSNPARPASDMRTNNFRKGMGNTCSPYVEPSPFVLEKGNESE